MGMEDHIQWLLDYGGPVMAVVGVSNYLNWKVRIFTSSARWCSIWNYWRIFQRRGIFPGSRREWS
jgi:hypothetical protein